jgi:hypothetical protein
MIACSWELGKCVWQARHIQSWTRGSRVAQGGLVVTEQTCREILSLPVHPYLTDAQALRIAVLIVCWGIANKETKPDVEEWRKP